MTPTKPPVRAGRWPVTSFALTTLGRVLQRAMHARNSFEPSGPTGTTVVRGAQVTTNLRYSDTHPNSYLDVYLADEGSPASRPTVVVVHGGGFIAGSKSDGDPNTKTDAAYWALGHGPLLDAGYNVVCLDYALAPQVPYPTPVHQLGQAITYLGEHADELGLDLGRVILSGGSAGGHIAAQYALAQTNPDYAARLGIAPTLIPAQLTAILLDSAPFDPDRVARTQQPSRLNNLLFGLSLRNYLGASPEVHAEATITDHATDAFPPAFIADGNTGTFPDQARDFADTLATLGVRHELVLYPRSEATLGHGFMAQSSTWTDDYNRRKIAFLDQTLHPGAGAES